MWKSFLTVVLVCSFSLLFAQSGKDYYAEGTNALDKKEYFEAIAALEAYLQSTNQAEKAYFPLSIAYYETGQLELASKYLTQLLNKGNEPRALLYYAKVLHTQNSFAEAAEYYKKYLPHTDQTAMVKKQIIHCRSGIDLYKEKSRAFVDNLGATINTAYDEMAPVLSPNHPNRVYFSAASPKSEGGKRDPNGFVNEDLGRFTFDMFKSEKENGIWQDALPLNPLLNTARHEILYGFTQEGLVAFFFRGFNLKFGEILTDTFRVDNQELTEEPVFNSPADAAFGDRDLCFVNDSTFIFSSVRPEGKGGYDLYVSKKQNGVWNDPVPLSDQINSPFHERSPHLNPGGDQLYFSSDRLESLGGFDVFTATLNKDKWSKPENLGKEINSASDEFYFVTAKDGYSAYFCSDRKIGYGGFDLYTAYFKEPLFVAGQKSANAFAKQLSEDNKGPENSPAKISNRKNWIVPSLLMIKEEEVLSAAQKEILNDIARKMMEFKEIDLNIFSFTDYEGPRKYDLYFALKQAENVGQYLIQQGISGSRLYITAAGSQYPIVMKDAGYSDPGINQRIDFRFTNIEELPFEIEYASGVPIDLVENSPYQGFFELTKGLTYSVQIAASQQLYESPVIEKYRNPLIRTRAGNPLIKYTIGIFDDYNEVRNLRYQLINEGYKGAFITAYIDGIRKTRDQLRNYLDQYEGLRSYINVE